VRGVGAYFARTDLGQWSKSLQEPNSYHKKDRNMNDGFVGDIGDYGKYGLLRCLLPAAKIRLGVAWIKTLPRAKRSNNVFEYLIATVNQDQSLADCDLHLYQHLRDLASTNEPTINDIQDSFVLPNDTLYYSEDLDFRDMPANGLRAKNARLQRRMEWFGDLYDRLEAADLVFFDPDTGLETPSRGRHTDEGPKYVCYDELKPFYDRGQSLIVYQHADRKTKFETAIHERAHGLRRNLGFETIWFYDGARCSRGSIS